MNNGLTQVYRNSGAALVISLVLLTLVTLIAIRGIKTVSLQEKMVANSYDRNLALQAAEAALREGEAIALAQSDAENAGIPAGAVPISDGVCAQSSCQNGLCGMPDPDCPDRWTVDSFNGWTDSTVELGDLAGRPTYFVEFLGEEFSCDATSQSSGSGDCSRYRVTALSIPGEGRAEVMLQSIYSTE